MYSESIVNTFALRNLPYRDLSGLKACWFFMYLVPGVVEYVVLCEMSLMISATSLVDINSWCKTSHIALQRLA